MTHLALGISQLGPAAGLLRSRGGGIVLPPAYTAATDDLFVAWPGYVYSDTAGTTLLTSAGNARGWRSLRGTLASSNANVAWDGVDTLTHTGSQVWDIPALVAIAQNATALTVAAVAGYTAVTGAPLFVSTNTLFAARAVITASSATSFDFVGGRRLDADSSQLVSASATCTAARQVQLGVLDWANALATSRRNGAETTGAFQTAGATSNTASAAVTLGGSALGGMTGPLSAAWFAPARAFDATQRASNAAALGALFGITW